MADLTVDQFRNDFPELADPATFPDSTFNFWLNVATLMINPNRWGTLLVTALELFVAHNIVLESLGMKRVAVGGLPGLDQGPLSSESPGAVSISYDTSSVMELNAGHWNSTIYGTRLIRMARLAGSGPVQVSGGCSGIGAWPGVLPPGF